jgi:hypothetical protein
MDGCEERRIRGQPTDEARKIMAEEKAKDGKKMASNGGGRGGGGMKLEGNGGVSTGGDGPTGPFWWRRVTLGTGWLAGWPSQGWPKQLFYALPSSPPPPAAGLVFFLLHLPHVLFTFGINGNERKKAPHRKGRRRKEVERGEGGRGRDGSKMEGKTKNGKNDNEPISGSSKQGAPSSPPSYTKRF